ncbi:unnamed protein product [Polarella glacialis]|uniref:Uncharacterized protein n=1 Tax=Polarella glacialis TaxID=89957 RepID=A0A813HP46_POLGL|nr:unnamed protein product [Polarella glacialis]
MSTTTKLVAEPMASRRRSTALLQIFVKTLPGSCATLACTPVCAEVAGPGRRRSDPQGVEIFEGTSPSLGAHESRAHRNGVAATVPEAGQLPMVCVQEELLAKFKATPGISAVKIQTYTLKDVKLNKKDAKKAMDKKAAEAEKFLERRSNSSTRRNNGGRT